MIFDQLFDVIIIICFQYFLWHIRRYLIIYIFYSISEFSFSLKCNLITFVLFKKYEIKEIDQKQKICIQVTPRTDVFVLLQIFYFHNYYVVMYSLC